jgi:hypothetical protein
MIVFRQMFDAQSSTYSYLLAERSSPSAAPVAARLRPR